MKELDPTRKPDATEVEKLSLEQMLALVLPKGRVHPSVGKLLNGYKPSAAETQEEFELASLANNPETYRRAASELNIDPDTPPEQVTDVLRQRLAAAFNLSSPDDTWVNLGKTRAHCDVGPPVRVGEFVFIVAVLALHEAKEGTASDESN